MTSFGTFLGGARAVLVTDLPAQEVERRINARARTLVGSQTGVSGWAGFGRLRLWHDSQPGAGDRLLAGRIRAREGGSMLHLGYRPPWFRIAITAAICAALAAYMLWAILFQGQLIAVPILAALVLAPFAFRFPDASAEREMEHLLAFLRDALEARDMAEPLAQDQGPRPGWR